MKPIQPTPRFSPQAAQNFVTQGEDLLQGVCREWQSRVDDVTLGGSKKHDVVIATLKLIDVLRSKKIDISNFFLEKPSHQTLTKIEQLIASECWLACSFLHPYFKCGYHDSGKIKVTEDTIEKRDTDDRWFGIKKHHRCGHLYGGELVDSVPNGYGLMEFRTGARYEGQWQKGLENGFGKRIFATGSLYQQGQFINGSSDAKIRNSIGFFAFLRKIFKAN